MADPSRDILVPPIDFYQNGSMRMILNNFEFIGRLYPGYFKELEERQNKLGERISKLQTRGKELNEQIKSLINSQKPLRVLTPSKFSTDYKFDVEKIAREMIKHIKSIEGDRTNELYDKNIHESFFLHRNKDKGKETRVNGSDLNHILSLMFKENRIPNIFPVNDINKSAHLEGLHDPRGEQSKRKIKCIDSILLFNTKENIFGEVELQAAKNRRRRKNQQRRTTNVQDQVLGLDLANTQTLSNAMSNTLVQNINASEIEFKPEKREAAKIELPTSIGLSGVVDFGFDGLNDFTAGMGEFFQGTDNLFDDDPFKDSFSTPLPEISQKKSAPSNSHPPSSPSQPAPVPPPTPLPGVSAPPGPPSESIPTAPAPVPVGLNIPAAPPLISQLEEANIPPAPPLPLFMPLAPARVAPPPITNERKELLNKVKEGNFRKEKNPELDNKKKEEEHKEKQVDKEEYLRQQVLLRYGLLNKKNAAVGGKKKKIAKNNKHDSQDAQAGHHSNEESASGSRSEDESSSSGSSSD